MQRALERILYIWALRHPASGYVQGINDLVRHARRPTSHLTPPTASHRHPFPLTTTLTDSPPPSPTHPPTPTPTPTPHQVTPFFMVFLSEHLPHGRPHTVEDVDEVPPAMLAQARYLVITPSTPHLPLTSP